MVIICVKCPAIRMVSQKRNNHATERPRSIGTRVYLELTVIKSRCGSLEVMDSSMTSAFDSAKRRSWMNSTEEVSKSFGALMSCMIKVFMDSSNVKFVIDSTLCVSSMTNCHRWTRKWKYSPSKAWCPRKKEHNEKQFYGQNKDGHPLSLAQRSQFRTSDSPTIKYTNRRCWLDEC